MDEASQQESWEFAGWGEARRIADTDSGPTEVSRFDQPVRHLLGTCRSTAICGNDITSRVLYLFRRVYAEVGSALPLNGGTYAVLPNTTNKKLAAGAACLTLLSYMATAVFSANEAIHYAANVIQGIPVIAGTIGLLAIFALLNILGISESASLALGIFVIHYNVESLGGVRLIT